MLCSDLDIEEIEEINVQAHGSLQEEVEVSPVEKCFQHLEEEDVQFDSAISCFLIICMLSPTTDNRCLLTTQGVTHRYVNLSREFNRRGF